MAQAARQGGAVVLAVLLAWPVAAVEGRPLTDAGIHDAVEDELAHDPAVPLNPIDVNVRNGVVTLSGKVPALAARERATTLAGTVKGVRAVVNTLEVVPRTERSAQAIRKDVEEALLGHPATAAHRVAVQVNARGGVSLGGTVLSWQERQLAARIASTVRGVTAVKNGLRVSNDRVPSPDRIRAQVLATLRWDALVDSGLVDVRVEDREVFLSGTVGSVAEKQRAIAAARVAGTERVDASGLEVARWTRDPELRDRRFIEMSDAAIHAAVTEALVRDPRVLSENVQVTVAGGQVVLRGSVITLAARRSAEQDARNTTGVRVVENRLRVRPGGPATNGDGLPAVEQALRRNVYLEPYEIDVTVRDGTAWLRGTVDSYFEKSQAQSVVEEVEGITEVKNLLQVNVTTEPLLDQPHLDVTPPDEYAWYDYDRDYTWVDDDRIRNAIESELFWSPFVDGNDVVVTVDDGVATLTGTVDGWGERRAATENAIEGGAVAVDNDIVVVEE